MTVNIAQSEVDGCEFRQAVSHGLADFAVGSLASDSAEHFSCALPKCTKSGPRAAPRSVNLNAIPACYALSARDKLAA